MHAWGITFLIGALATVSVILLIVVRMANQLKHVAAEQRISSIFLDLPRIIRDFNRLFPQSETLLAFWLSFEFLLIWLACIVVSLAMNL